MATTDFTNGVSLSDAGWADDVDCSAYSVLSGVAGTNTITATGPATYSYSATRPPVWIIPAVTNTGATTINVTPSGASALGAKNVFWNGAACVGGELRAGVPTAIIYDGTQFHVIASNFNARATNSLGADVAVSTSVAYFDGPSVAQGSAGTWFASGTVSVKDPSSAANILAKLWDGTTVIASANAYAPTGATAIAIALSGYLASPAGNIRISVRNVTTTNGSILFNETGNSKDSTVSAIRIA
jgi:hypothetical protein